jgi:hypothetical protein
VTLDDLKVAGACDSEPAATRPRFALGRGPDGAVRSYERKQQRAERYGGEENPRLHGTVLFSRMTEQPGRGN